MKPLEYAVDSKTHEPPIRAELFSSERLQEHASSLAANQVIAARRGKRHQLVRRTADNEKKLLQCYNAATQQARERKYITPASEWLLDNYRLIEEQFEEVHRGLQAPSYLNLPQLAHGPLAGKPHIYGVIWAFIAHTDSRFDATLLKTFLKAYQKTQPLRIAELWSIPITLRCVMIENLRRVSLNVATRQAARHKADKFADELLELAKREPKKIDAVLHELTTQPLAPSFTVQLIQRLRYQDISLLWLTQDLTNQGLSLDGLVQTEHATQPKPPTT